jgi:hypothetical protein
VSVSFRDRHGTLWFGTDAGLSRLSLETDQVQLPPPVFISSLQIPGVDYRISEIGETNVGELKLSEDQNDLQITLLGLSSGDADGLLYQYKLEGSNNDWSRLSNQRTVNYVNLASGRYASWRERLTPTASQARRLPAFRSRFRLMSGNAGGL